MSDKAQKLDRHLRDLVSRRRLERAASLVNDGRVFRRVKNGDALLADVLTDDLVCHAEVDVGAYSFTTRCDCGEAVRYCEHAVAVAMAYVGDEESFFDLVEFLDDLPRFRKADLVRMLRNILGRDPESLNALGLPGFEEPLPESDELDLTDADEIAAPPVSADDLFGNLARLNLGVDDEPEDPRLN